MHLLIWVSFFSKEGVIKRRDGRLHEYKGDLAHRELARAFRISYLLSHNSHMHTEEFNLTINVLIAKQPTHICVRTHRLTRCSRSWRWQKGAFQ